jgi:uncharacterized protein YwgA
MGRHFTLLILMFDVLGEKIERRRVQETVYILKCKHNLPFPYEFQEYWYGHYSEQLQDALDILVSAKVLEEKIEEDSDGSLKYVYSLTGTGKSLAEKIREEIDDRTILEKLERAKENLADFLESPTCLLP